MGKMVLTVIMIMLYPMVAFTQETMRIVYFNDFPPYSWEDFQSREMKGILVDILNEAIQDHMGIKLSHKGYPCLRAQKMVKSGKADAFVTLINPERKKFTIASNEPVLTRQVTIYTQKGHPKMEQFRKIKSLDDLKGFKLLDYIGNGWSKQHLAGFVMEISPTFTSVLLKLAAGRGDLALNNSHVSNYMIKKLGLQDRVVEIPTVLDSDTFHLCIRKDSPHTKILKGFDEKIRKMRKNGKLQAIINRYK